MCNLKHQWLWTLDTFWKWLWQFHYNDCPEVTLGGWHDVEIQLLTNHYSESPCQSVQHQFLLCASVLTHVLFIPKQEEQNTTEEVNPMVTSVYLEVCLLMRCVPYELTVSITWVTSPLALHCVCVCWLLALPELPLLWHYSVCACWLLELPELPLLWHYTVCVCVCVWTVSITWVTSHLALHCVCVLTVTITWITSPLALHCVCVCVDW